MAATSILDRIRLHLRSDSDTLAAIERDAGISNGIVRKWGEKAPSSDSLLRVAQLIGVSVDYLLTGQEYQAPGTAVISEKERELLDVYRGLDNEGQIVVLATAYKERRRLPME